MSNIKKISRNAFWLSIAEILSKGLAFVATVLITQHLTRETFGQYNFVLSFGLIFSVLANFGFGAYTTREIAKNKAQKKKIVGNLLTIKLVLTVLVLILIFIAARFVNKPIYVISGLYLVGFLIVFDALRGFWGSIFQAHEKIGYLAFTRLGERIIYLSLLFVVIKLRQGLLMVIGSLLMSSLIFNVLELILINFKFVRLSLRFDWSFIKKVLVGTFFFVLNDIFIIIFFKIDTVMISLMKNDTLTAIYSAAYNFIFAIIFIPTVLSTVLYPVLTRFFKKNRDLFRNHLSLIIKYYFLISLPVVVFLFFFAPELIFLVYRGKYFESLNVFRCLSLVLVFVFLNFVLSMILNTVEKQKFVAIASFTAMVLNLALNFILIPSYDIIGAAIATVITEMIFCAALLFFLNREFKIINKITLLKTLKIILALIFGLIVSYFLMFNVYLAFTVFATIFTFFLLIFKVFSKKDQEYFFEALHLK